MHRDRWPNWGGGNAARAVVLSSVGLAVAAAAPAGPPPEYTVQIIQNQCGGPFPDSRTIGTGLNNLGQVCGFFWPCDGDIEDIGFVWSAETGIVPIPVPPGVVVVTPADMNDKGQITGKVRLTSGHERGFLLTDGQWTFIEPLCPGGHSDGRALNARGAITGVRSAPICVGVFWGYVYDREVITDIVPTVRERYADSVPQDISLNEVVGWQGQSGSEGLPFVWSQHGMMDLQLPSGTTSGQPKAVTDCSAAVGFVASPARALPIATAVVWEQTFPELLPVLPGFDESKARDISEHFGIIVGSCDSPDVPAHGVMWCDKKVYDLNTLIDVPGVHIGSAVRINDSGQILCLASLEGGFGYTATVLLTPSPTLVGDLDGDGTVGAPDVAILFASWGACIDPCDCSMDLDVNHIVNGFDLAILLANWS